MKSILSIIYFMNFTFVLYKNIYLFIWLYWLLVEACEIFHCGPWALECVGSVVVASRLSCPRLWNLPGPGIKPVSLCIGRWILNHWTTREVPECYYCPWKLQGECSPPSAGLPPLASSGGSLDIREKNPCLFNTLGNKGWLLPLSINKHYLLLFLC